MEQWGKQQSAIQTGSVPAPKIYAHIHQGLNGGVSQLATSQHSTPAKRLASSKSSAAPASSLLQDRYPPLCVASITHYPRAGP
jgi:hypothetical protein